MIQRYLFLSILFLFSFSAGAFEPSVYEENAFLADQDKGRVILVDVYAKWCPTCKKQHSDIAELFKDEKYKGVKTYKLDYDNKSLVAQFSKLIGKPIPRQSTVVVFKGKDVISFSVAETGDKLKVAIDKAL